MSPPLRTLRGDCLALFINSQVAGSVVTNHSIRSAEPLDLKVSLPKLDSDALVLLNGRVKVLLAEAEGLDSAEAHLDHAQEGWCLQNKWALAAWPFEF